MLNKGLGDVSTGSTEFCLASWESKIHLDSNGKFEENLFSQFFSRKKWLCFSQIIQMYALFF